MRLSFAIVVLLWCALRVGDVQLIRPRLLGLHGGLLLGIVVVQVLAEQILHVEAAGSKYAFEVDRTEPDWHLPLIV